jgi:glucose 1-dehydrogenase
MRGDAEVQNEEGERQAHRKTMSRQLVSLTNKVVVVTGGTRGLGLAIAQACVEAGASVVVSSRSQKAVEQAVKEIQSSGRQATGCVCDVADAGQVKAVADLALNTFGHLDVWVNNAGVSAPFGPTLSVSPQRFMQVVQTNIVGVYNGSFVALQHFVAQGHGKLINVLGLGDSGPQPLQNAYGSSKTWVRNFTLALSKEYKGSGVEVIAYNPGLVITEMLTDVEVTPGYEEKVQPLRTVVELWGNPPQTPARRVVWLASSATDGRNALMVRELNSIAMLKGLLRAGVRRLSGRAAPDFPMEVHVIAQ